MESHYCTSDMERILEGQGSFICLPLSDKAAKTILDRSVGLWTWLAVLAAIGVVTSPIVNSMWVCKSTRG